MGISGYGILRNHSKVLIICEKLIKLRRHTTEQNLLLAKAPLERVFIDVPGERIGTPRGNLHLLLVTDRFKKLVEIILMRTDSAMDLAKLFVNEYVFHLGPTVGILLANEGFLVSRIFQEVCNLLNVQKILNKRTTPRII